MTNEKLILENQVVIMEALQMIKEVRLSALSEQRRKTYEAISKL